MWCSHVTFTCDVHMCCSQCDGCSHVTHGHPFTDHLLQTSSTNCLMTLNLFNCDDNTWWHVQYLIHVHMWCSHVIHRSDCMWCSHVMFDSDVHMWFCCRVCKWCSHVMFTRALHMLFIQVHHMWWSHVMITCDFVITSTRNIHMWCSHVILPHVMFTCDLLTWCAHVI